MGELVIKTIWRTAAEHCELVIGRFSGCHVCLWVRNQLIVDEPWSDIDDAVRRAWELRLEWPQLAE